MSEHPRFTQTPHPRERPSGRPVPRFLVYVVVPLNGLEPLAPSLRSLLTTPGKRMAAIRLEGVSWHGFPPTQLPPKRATVRRPALPMRTCFGWTARRNPTSCRPTRTGHQRLMTGVMKCPLWSGRERARDVRNGSWIQLIVATLYPWGGEVFDETGTEDWRG